MAYLTYDPEVLQKFAQGLYSRARNIVIVYVAVGIVIGIPVGMFVAGFLGQALGLPRFDVILTLASAAIGALIVGILGGMIGQGRAFILKIHAQTALCQVAIEENTRPRR